MLTCNVTPLQGNKGPDSQNILENQILVVLVLCQV